LSFLFDSSSLCFPFFFDRSRSVLKAEEPFAAAAVN
jgi:hypothetical protein